MALENYLYSGHEDVATAEYMFDLVLKTIMIDPDDNMFAPLVGTLLDAYWDAVHIEEENTVKDMNIPRLTGLEADTMMRDAFCKITGHHEDDCVYMWPDAIPYDNDRARYPKKMMVIIVKCLVQRDAAWRRAMMKFAEEERAQATS